MLEQLIEKSTTFNPNTLNVADSSNLDILGLQENFRLEWTDTGCYYLKDGFIKFINYENGRTYQLDRDWIAGEWNLYRHLYLKGWEAKTFRIDPPLRREEVDLHGIIWEYTEFYRPGPSNGDLQFLSSLDFLQNFKTDVYELLKAAKEVATENNCQGLPKFKFERIKDADGYYFVKNFKEWLYPIDTVIRNVLKQVLVMNMLINPWNQEVQDEIKAAKDLWSTLI